LNVQFANATVSDSSLVYAISWRTIPIFQNVTIQPLSSPIYRNRGVVSSNMTIPCAIQGALYGSDGNPFYAYKHTFSVDITYVPIDCVNGFTYGLIYDVGMSIAFSANAYGGYYYLQSRCDIIPNLSTNTTSALNFNTQYEISETVIYNNTLHYAFHNIKVYNASMLDNPSYLLSNLNQTWNVDLNFSQISTLQVFDAEFYGSIWNDVYLPYDSGILSYQYSFTSIPISTTVDLYDSARGVAGLGTTRYDYIVLLQGTTYTYDGYIYYNSKLVGNGTFLVKDVVGVSLIKYSFGFQNVLLGTVTNGHFMFNFQPRNNPNSIVYENVAIILNVNIGTGTGNNISFTEPYLLAWQQASVAPPAEPLIAPSGFGSSTMANFLAIFLLIFVPPAVLGVCIGQTGLFIGLVLSIGAGSITTPPIIPLWLDFIIGMTLVILLYERFKGALPDFGGVIVRRGESTE